MKLSSATVPHALDVALAQACAAGDAAALGRFEREIMPGALEAAAGILAPCDLAELAQTLRIRLFVRETASPPRIATYNGSVSLRAWVRVVARRCAINLRAARPRWIQDFGDYLNAHTSPPPSPERSAARSQEQQHFKQVFDAAVRTLASRERLVLRLHFSEGLTLQQLAAAYGVSRSTVVRWVATGRATVDQRTRAALGHVLGPTARELDSWLRGALSSLDINISGVFSPSTH